MSLRISIDGPTASGKTTLGVGLARHYEASFLDTGLTFRAIALLCSLDGVMDPSVLAGSWTERVRHEIAAPPEFVYRVLIDGSDVSDAIFGFEADVHLDDVARSGKLRSEILQVHTEMVANDRVIAAGRDVGEALLLNADVHIYLTAAFHIRRERRRQQTLKMPQRSVVVGPATALDRRVRSQLEQRPNTIDVDTTFRTPAAVLRMAVGHIDRRVGIT